MTPEIVITVGLPGCGKSTHVKTLTDRGYRRINRDQVGGHMRSPTDLIYMALRSCYAAGDRQFVMDNTFTRLEHRQVLIEVARSLGLQVRVLLFPMDLDQAQVFAARRQVQRLGKLLRPEEYKDHADDPNLFPPGVQYAFQKAYTEPTLAEGFASIDLVKVGTVWGAEYANKAIILDLDGTVRTTEGTGVPYPRTPDEVKILPGRRELLLRKQREGYLLLGATNQSGISQPVGVPKYVSEAMVQACIQRTNDLLALDTPLDVLYATERGGPPQSFWRKPLTGMAVLLIELYRLDPATCLVVGDQTTDKSFAEKVGIPFQWAHEFFK